MNPFLGAYCERAGLDGALAEPLNAATNIAFLVVAAAIWRRLAANPSLRLGNAWDIALLAAIVLVIGLGSGAWHLWPMRATLLADVIPISLFIHVYLVAFTIRVLKLSWPWAALILAAFVAAGSGFRSLLSERAVDGTLAYLPAYVMLAIMTTVLFATGHERQFALLAVLGIWTVSLALRAVDGAACAHVPIGTHFLWHLLNAAVLYGLLRILTAAAERGKG